MDNSYYKRHWNSFAPRYQHPPTAWQVPVRRPAAPSTKVVSIPVEFMGSERKQSDSAVRIHSLRSSPAVRIQKAFRGFLVRKSVKKIAAIKGEVDEIERQISKKETVELMRREAKERLRVNETLMGLLLRLDSVKGVDSGVREFRRAVTKKAIALQERVDNTVADDDQTLGDDLGADDWELISQTVDGAMEGNDSGEGNEDGENPQIGETLELQSVAPVAEEDCNSNTSEEISETGFDNLEKVGYGSEEEGGSGSRYVTAYNRENSIEGVGENKVENQEEEQEEDGMDSVEIVEGENEGGNGGGFGERDREENRRSRELLERMVEDNEQMMGMMVDLFEKNEMQTRMLSSLSQRVEQLEKAFVCEALRRRKKRHAAAADYNNGWKHLNFA